MRLGLRDVATAACEIPWVYDLQKVTCMETCRKEYNIAFTTTNSILKSAQTTNDLSHTIC
jgi:hypothetical protein